MGIVVEQKEAGRMVTLEGAIDIACAAELKTALLEAFSEGQPWLLSLASVTYLDVTALQLLWAAMRQARAGGVGLEIDGEVPSLIVESLADAGFEPFLVANAV